jgi:predicted RNase H-like HicB family nuclease
MELNARVRVEDDGSLWAEVEELPGCFASGDGLDELVEALAEAVFMHTHEVEGDVRSEPGDGPRLVPTAVRLEIPDAKLQPA